MAIFRLQDNMPDAYVRKSRDFQLLCNSFDAVFNGVKNDIDSIVNTADTRLCSDRLLPLLQTKLGFFTKERLSITELRTALQAFKYVVRDKGSQTGIEAAIEVFLKVANASSKSKITIVNNFLSGDKYTSAGNFSNTYIVEVAIEGQPVDTTLLTELLRYVLPAGYQLKYSFYTSLQSVTQIQDKDTVHIVFVNIGDNDGVKLTMNDDPAHNHRNINGVSTTALVTDYTPKRVDYTIDWANVTAPFKTVGDDIVAAVVPRSGAHALAVGNATIWESFDQDQYVEIGLHTMGATELTFKACFTGDSMQRAHFGVKVGDIIYWDCPYDIGRLARNGERMKSYSIVGQTMVALGEGKFGEAPVTESKTFTTSDISKINALVIKPITIASAMTIHVSSIIAKDAVVTTSFEDAKKATLPSNEPESDWLKELEES